MQAVFVTVPFLSVSLSVGKCMLLTLRLDIELDKVRLDEIPREGGYRFRMSRSLPGRHVSIIIAQIVDKQLGCFAALL